MIFFKYVDPQPVICGVGTPVFPDSTFESDRSSCIYLTFHLLSGNMQNFGMRNIIYQGIPLINYVLCKEKYLFLFVYSESATQLNWVLHQLNLMI